jgi:superfamily II DNA/RNA helicase
LTSQLSSSPETDISFRCITKLTELEQKRIEKNKQPGFNLLVTTPMSFLNMFQGKEAVLKDVEYIVLDECDKYF